MLKMQTQDSVGLSNQENGTLDLYEELIDYKDEPTDSSATESGPTLTQWTF